MGNFTYTTGIPNPPNNPSSDVPGMQTNCNSLNSLISVDHIGFNDGSNNGGRHLQVQMPVQGSIPSGLIGGEGTLYTKSGTGAQLFYTPGVSGNEYQLTRVIGPNFATFGTFTNYPPAVVNQNGGWTFLPGGLLYQYGTMQTTGSSTAVVFPIMFSSGLYSLNISYSQSSGGGATYGYTQQSQTGFKFNTSTGTVGINFFWMAIGN